MRSARSKRAKHYPESWDEMAQGQWLQQELNILLQPYWSKMFGYYMLKLGPLAEGIDSHYSTIRNQYHLSMAADADIKGSLTSLPIAANSIDAVVMPFCLEFSEDPHQVMREAVRVLTPQGHLLLIGFNPFGMVGLGKAGWRSRKQYPWCGQFYSEYRMRDWLKLLGNEVLSEQRAVYASLRGRNPPRPFQQLIFSHYFPRFGSVYLLMVKKREIPVNLIKAKWYRRPVVKPLSIIPSANCEPAGLAERGAGKSMGVSE